MTKLRISNHRSPAITIAREAVRVDKLVYVAVANRALHYPHARSRIVYIGTTKNGSYRMAASAAAKAEEMLDLHGVTDLKFYAVTCTPRQNVKTWHKLERGLIMAFKHVYGTIPRCNTQGKNMRWTDELEYFTRGRLENVVKYYSKTGSG